MKAGPYIKLEVTDTGPGIKPEVIDRIFDPFYTSKETGHGLGLAAVLGIVTAHHGIIKVYSDPGKGSTFRVLLPAVENLKKNTEPEIPYDTGVSERGTVLIVDDDEAIRQTTSAMLTMNGFDVPLATDGDEAVHIYRHRLEEIQAALLDLTMPGMSGEETFAQLRAINPEVSIVLSSGYNKRETTAQLASDELATFLQKPYRIAELMHALDSVARRKG